MTKILAKITLKDLYEISNEADYDWKEEILPRLAQITESIYLNMETREICMLALTAIAGIPKKRQFLISMQGKQ